MFRLKATLVATTLMRPWRTGWSMDRSVEFSLPATVKRSAPPPMLREDRPTAERRCFIDEDWAAPAGVSVVRSFASLAATKAANAPPVEDACDATGMRAWWSVSGKPSRT